MSGKKSRRMRELARKNSTPLRSGMAGNGGRCAPNNGYPDIVAAASSPHEGKQRPYRILRTTSSEYSTTVADNSTMLWRDER